MSTPITSFAQLDPNGTYTYANYTSWQFEELVELLRGKVVRRQSTPAEPHQATVGQLFGAIGGFLRQQLCRARLGPYDVRLPTPGTTAGHAIDTVVQPDICVICDPSKIEPSSCLGAPDFIVEVLSPGAMARDWRDKFTLYEEAGVGEYWIVSPQAQFVAAFVLDVSTGHYRFVGEYAGPGLVPCATLPGLGLDWSDIFTERAR